MEAHRRIVNISLAEVGPGGFADRYAMSKAG
jgi:hypothetical protein